MAFGAFPPATLTLCCISKKKKPRISIEKGKDICFFIVHADCPVDAIALTFLQKNIDQHEQILFEFFEPYFEIHRRN